jgi:hypothetical protein
VQIQTGRVKITEHQREVPGYQANIRIGLVQVGLKAGKGSKLYRPFSIFGEQEFHSRRRGVMARRMAPPVLDPRKKINSCVLLS